MIKVSKEFWVSDEHLDKINSDVEFSLILRNKDESSFMDSVINKATNKITISYEIDREITIKESDIDNAFNVWGETGVDGFKKAFKQKLFGGEIK